MSEIGVADALVYGIIGFVVLFMLLRFFRSGRFWRCLSYSAVTGLGGLLVTYGVGLYTVPLLTVSPLSVVLSAALGLPGVIGMLVLQLL